MDYQCFLLFVRKQFLIFHFLRKYLFRNLRIDNEELSKQDIEKFIIDDDNYCFVGILEDKIVAFLYGYGMLRPDGKSMFYIHSVDVFEDYQNNGIGTQLIDYVLK